MNNKDMPIGVFDSGMGGLTVLRALREAMPHESFIYLGDTARLPYGTKSANTVEQYAVQMARILVERQVKAMVIACNTATTAALSHLQQMLKDIPVIGVVEPGAKAAVCATQNQQIAVIATETTIASNAYQNALLSMLPKVKIAARSCGLLVSLAEEGMVDNSVAKAAFDYYLEDFKSEDTLLLGCTHFPVFKSYLSTRLPTSVTLVDSAVETAKVVKQELINRDLTSYKQHGHSQYLVTDSIQRFQKIGALFLGDSLEDKVIEFIDV